MGGGCSVSHPQMGPKRGVEGRVAAISHRLLGHGAGGVDARLLVGGHNELLVLVEIPGLPGMLHGPQGAVKVLEVLVLLHVVPVEQQQQRFRVSGDWEGGLGDFWEAVGSPRGRLLTAGCCGAAPFWRR